MAGCVKNASSLLFYTAVLNAGMVARTEPLHKAVAHSSQCDEASDSSRPLSIHIHMLDSIYARHHGSCIRSTVKTAAEVALVSCSVFQYDAPLDMAPGDEPQADKAGVAAYGIKA